MVAKGMNVNPDLCACNINNKSINNVPINTNMLNNDEMPTHGNVQHIEANITQLETAVMNGSMKPEEISKYSYGTRTSIKQFLTDDSKREKELLNRLDNVDKYNMINIQQQQQKTLDTLTIISTIFLPLTLIVAYFGMNFKKMSI